MAVREFLIHGVGALLCVACTSVPTPIEHVVSSSSGPLHASSASPNVGYSGPLGCVPSGHGTDYEVGPGKKFAAIGDVPFELLKAGDTVRIHHRPEPYKEKLMVSGAGKPDAPIKICGVKGANGELPVLDGAGATTRATLDFPYDGHQVRGLIIVGHKHSDPWTLTPEHIVIEGLELKNAAVPHHFIDKVKKDVAYSENAAGIFVERANHVVIRGNVVHGNENGIFVGSTGGAELTRDVLIEGNYVFDNGSQANYYHHNVYNEASGVVYQFNRFGPPRAGPRGILGANIKERSAGVVIRYNWIEDGAHLIDLVDAQEARDPNLKSDTFHESWVYGNVLLRGPTWAGSMVHYGGDSGVFETYRKGTLHFFHNTVVVENAGYKDYEGAMIFELSTNDENLDSRNNVYFSAPPRPNTPVALLGARDHIVSGKATFSGDFIRLGIQRFDNGGGDVKIVASETGFDASVRGDSPGFNAPEKRDFRLTSACVIKGKGVTLAHPQHPVNQQYSSQGNSAPGRAEQRPNEPRPTPGAFSAPP